MPSLIQVSSWVASFKQRKNNALNQACTFRGLQEVRQTSVRDDLRVALPMLCSGSFPCFWALLVDISGQDGFFSLLLLLRMSGPERKTVKFFKERMKEVDLLFKQPLQQAGHWLLLSPGFTRGRSWCYISWFCDKSCLWGFRNRLGGDLSRMVSIKVILPQVAFFQPYFSVIWDHH